MPRIFISYSRKDDLRAQELADHLRRVYKREDVWMDDRMNFGQEFWQEILGQIQQTDIFLFLLSPDSLESPYCRAELKEAMRLKKAILPIQLAPVTEPLSEKAQTWKMRLDKILMLDATSGFTVNNFARLQESIQRLAPYSPAVSMSPPVSMGEISKIPTDRAKSRSCTIIIIAVLASFALVAFLVFGSGITITNIEGNRVAIGDFILNMIFPGRVTDTPAPTNLPAAATNATLTPLPESTSDLSSFRSISVSGIIESSAEEDRYTFTGRAGDLMRVVTIATSDKLNSTPAIRSDKNVTVCEGSITTDVLDCLLPADGTYTAAVYDFWRREIGTYNIIIQRLNNPDGCTLLQPGTVFSAIIASTAQQDCYTFTGNAGYNIRVTTTANDGSLNPTPAIYQVDGTSLCEGSITTDTLECLLPADGTFTIFVYDFWRKESGSYTISFT